MLKEGFHQVTEEKIYIIEKSLHGLSHLRHVRETQHIDTQAPREELLLSMAPALEELKESLLEVIREV